MKNSAVGGQNVKINAGSSEEGVLSQPFSVHYSNARGIKRTAIFFTDCRRCGEIFVMGTLRRFRFVKNKPPRRQGECGALEEAHQILPSDLAFISPDISS